MGNGMKPGSGEDPFENVGDDDDEGDQESPEQRGGGRDLDEPATDNSGNGGVSLPWKYARENAKSNRDMVQFFLQQETKQREEVAQSELEDRLGEDVLTFDLREAAYQVALEQHLDDVAGRLREWGYDAD